MRNKGVVILFAAALLAVAAMGVSASTIHQASAKGDILLVKTLIKNTPSLVSERDERDVTPLHLACFYGQRSVVRFLLSAGAPVDAVTKSGYTPLLWAAWRKHTSVMKILLSKGADINARSTAGMTPLHFAVQNGDKAMAEFLLSKGADVKEKDTLGQTAADLARKGKAASLIALFENPSTPRQVVNNIVAASKPVMNSSHGALKPVTKNVNIAVQPLSKPKPVLPKHTRAIKTVVHRVKPAPKVVLTRSVILAVMTAAEAEKPEALQFMLDRQPGLRSASDRNGATLMHWLAEADWPEGIEILSKAGGDINAPKKNGVTPLQVAAALGKIKALDTLMGLGAKSNLEDSKGRTALSIAQERGQEEASDILLKNP